MLLVLILLVLIRLVTVLLVLMLLVLMGWEIYGKIKYYRWIFFRESIQDDICNIIYRGDRTFFITFYYIAHFHLAQLH